MPRSIACDYCGADIEPGTGTMFVRLNGQTVHFCSSKCEKNADLGREARDLEWTEAGRDTRGEAAETRAQTDETTDATAAADGTRDTDIEDQGQAVDAVDDGDADLESVEPDEAVGTTEGVGPEGEGAAEAVSPGDEEAAEPVDAQDDEDAEAGDESDESDDEETEEAQA